MTTTTETNETLAAPILLFVYGSLREGKHNHRLLMNISAKRVGDAATAPVFTMLDLGSYPGLKHDGKTAIVGEVYEIPNVEALANVDRLEGHPHYYERQLVTVQAGVEDVSIDLPVWIYVLNRARQEGERPVVDGGDWCAYLAERQLSYARDHDEEV